MIDKIVVVRIAVLGLAIIFNATANILIKVGMNKIGETNGIMELAKKAVVQPQLIAGIISFIMAFVSYSYILTKLNLSVAYPIMVSMGLVIVVTVSYFWLQESINIIQILGFIFIIVGVWMVAK
ncbi:MAG: SMR family transporter [bacterium]